MNSGRSNLLLQRSEPPTHGSDCETPGKSTLTNDGNAVDDQSYFRNREGRIIAARVLLFLLVLGFPVLCLQLNVRGRRNNAHSHHRQLIVESIDKDSLYVPGIALMMGFPFSGQTFLQRAVHDMTGTSTAINYGQATMNIHGIIGHGDIDSVPLYKSRWNGPFAFSDSLPFPAGGHVLTRTYCAGHCVSCWPHEYIKKASVFFSECHGGSRFRRGEDMVSTNYDSRLVTKYVHLMRNPLTHIAARFENQVTGWKARGQIDFLKEYPSGKKGFQRWCHDFDDNFFKGKRFELEKQLIFMDPELLALAQSVPCHTDFFRLVQWHNLAFESALVEIMSNKPRKIIFYEDIVDSPEQTMEDLLFYLEITPVRKGGFAKLEEMANHPPYYEENQIENIKKYINVLSSVETWDYLSRYFL